MKKAQVTIFILVGIILLGIVFSAFIFSSKVNEEIKQNEQQVLSNLFSKESLRIQMNDCISDDLDSYLIKLTKQGILFEEDGTSVSLDKAYMHSGGLPVYKVIETGEKLTGVIYPGLEGNSFGKKNLRSINDIRINLAQALKNKVILCMENEISSQSNLRTEVLEEDSLLIVSFTNNDIKVNGNFNLQVTFTDGSTLIQNINSEFVKVTNWPNLIEKFYVDVIDKENSLLDYEIKEDGQNLNLGGADLDIPGLNAESSFRSLDKQNVDVYDNLYTIKFVDSNSVPYELNFIIENRYPVILEKDLVCRNQYRHVTPGDSGSITGLISELSSLMKDPDPHNSSLGRKYGDLPLAQTITASNTQRNLSDTLKISDGELSNEIGSYGILISPNVDDIVFGEDYQNEIYLSKEDNWDNLIHEPTGGNANIFFESSPGNLIELNENLKENFPSRTLDLIVKVDLCDGTSDEITKPTNIVQCYNPGIKTENLCCSGSNEYLPLGSFCDIVPSGDSPFGNPQFCNGVSSSCDGEINSDLFYCGPNVGDECSRQDLFNGEILCDSSCEVCSGTILFNQGDPSSLTCKENLDQNDEGKFCRENVDEEIIQGVVSNGLCS